MVIVNVLAEVHSRPFPITSHRLGHNEDLAPDIFILYGSLSYHYINKCQHAITCFIIYSFIFSSSIVGHLGGL